MEIIIFILQSGIFLIILDIAFIPRFYLFTGSSIRPIIIMFLFDKDDDLTESYSNEIGLSIKIELIAHFLNK